jgi:hypothetical protein
MRIVCPTCTKTLAFSGERPRFCAFCGQSLGSPTDDALTAEQATVVQIHRPTAAATDAHPETIGGYRLLRRLGGGGMGAVYEAEEIASGRHVALKLVLAEFTSSPDALARFRQEGRLASTLAHPRCVFVHAADEDAGRPYIVMELMPGGTLDDLVRERGPLPPEEAIVKILDVIDGLDEAHRRGLVHRDVKPSNCFLETGGRVKIGDFGLSRSLEDGGKLTRTGSFIGTPLYAAPEQIHRNEPTDAQSDVYAVAATLYFLLTGQAPFQSAGDAMATLARKVTDNPPPMRSVRPSLPKALDKVVLRGLERERRRRYKDVAELRRALVPFLPARPSAVGMGLRYIAWRLDRLVCWAVEFVVGWGQVWLMRITGTSLNLDQLFYAHFLAVLIQVTYFGVLEGIWGWSPGKFLLRLRVGTAAAPQPPGVWRAMQRAAILAVLLNAGQWLAEVLAWMVGVSSVADPRTVEEQLITSGLLVLIFGGFVLGSVAVVSTMRVQNGYRGLHEFLTGTRTYQLRWPRPRRRQTLLSRPFELPIERPAALPECVGPFTVRGALRWTDEERVLVAEDPRLGRVIWIWMRPAIDAPLDGAQRDIDRATRVRWVSGGTDGAWQWDAFMAPGGMPLPALAVGPPRLGWGNVRVILEDLADELGAGCADGTLPRTLTAEQVWVQPDGRVRLLPLPIAVDRAPAVSAADQEFPLQLLREVAVIGLEGTARPIAATGDRVRAPVPVHAEELLGRLFGNRQPYTTVAQLREDLELVRERPAEVSRMRRAVHLAAMLVFLHLPFFGPTMLVTVGVIFLQKVWEHYESHTEYAPFMSIGFGIVCAIFGFWVVWSFLTRGGYLFWRGGIVLRRADGRKATRLQCGLRALLVWGPVFVLYFLAFALAQAVPQLPWLCFAVWGLGTVLLPLYAALAIALPQRSLHDRIAGTCLMPE